MLNPFVDALRAMRAWHVVARQPVEYSDRRFWDMLVQRDPGEALIEIDHIVLRGRMSADERALACSARSRCLFELGRLGEAVDVASQAMADSTALAPGLRSAIVMSSAVILAEAGSVDAALLELHRLQAESVGLELGRVKIQTAYVLHSAGRLHDAIEELDASERLFDEHRGEPRDLVRLHQNRGLVLLQQGRLGDAEVDLAAAGAVAAEAGMTAAQAQSVANLAVLHGRARRLKQSLSEFDRAAALFAAAGNPVRTVAHAELDRAEVMMHSGVPSDAVKIARAAVERIEPSGNRVMVGDATLLLARAELAAGFVQRAVRSAEDAAETFRASARNQMSPLARSVMVQCELVGARSREASAGAIERAVAVAVELRDAGWEAGADDLAVARLRTARRWALLDPDDIDIARLRSDVAKNRRDTLLRGWWAEALGRIGESDLPGARLACHAGLAVLDDIVAEAATLEERSAAMQIGRDLSHLLIEIAVERGDADEVLSAAEGTRARSLHDELANADRHHPLSLEGAERLRSDLGRCLGDRVLVEWIELDERIGAVVFSADGARLVDVGERTALVRAVDRVRMWLDIAVAEPDGPSQRAVTAMTRLEAVLLAPLELPPDVGVVIVPTGMLHGVPWSGLPDLVDRPFSLAPNGQFWVEAALRSHGINGASVIVGPDASETERELTAARRSSSGAALAAGADATAETVRTSLANVDLVHIAAHGTFRSDRPLLSTLRLHDGEATLYEAVPDRVASKLVILSSCDGGAQGTTDGSEVLGLSSVLLARGAAAVLAPLTAVRELECAEFVAEVHDELAAGRQFAAAVATVRTRWLADDDLSRWAVASSFTCFGSGAVTVSRAD